MPITARVGCNGDLLLGQSETFLRLGPISIVSQKMSLKGCLQEGIKSVDVMAVARDLDCKINTAFGREDEMLTDTVKPAFQRGAVTCAGKPPKPLLFACSYRPANIYGMRVNDEKGGLVSPSISTKVFERHCIKGVRSARRSAQLGRLRRRGNN